MCLKQSGTSSSYHMVSMGGENEGTGTLPQSINQLVTSLEIDIDISVSFLHVENSPFFNIFEIR